MGVALGGSGLTMPEYVADEVKAVAARYSDRGEAVPKVMDADIVEPSSRPDVAIMQKFAGRIIRSSARGFGAVETARFLVAPSDSRFGDPTRFPDTRWDAPG